MFDTDVIFIHNNSLELSNGLIDTVRENRKFETKSIVDIIINLNLKLSIKDAINNNLCFSFNVHDLEADISLGATLDKVLVLSRLLELIGVENGIAVKTIKEAKDRTPYIEGLIAKDCHNYLRISIVEGEFEGNKTLLLTIKESRYNFVLGKFLYNCPNSIFDKVADLKSKSTNNLPVRLIFTYIEPENEYNKREITFEFVPIIFSV